MTKNKFSYRVYYEDTDLGGAMYYANHLKFFERARTDFLLKSNINQTDLLNKENSIFVIKKCEIEYLAPAKFEDLIEVSVTTTETRNASIVMEQEITKLDQIISRLKVEIVFVDADNFKPKKLPQNLKNIFNAW